MNEFYLRNVVEAALLAAGKPLQLAELGQLFEETTRPKVEDLQAGLTALAADYENRGLELKETAAGFRIQVRKEFAGEISRLWPERPAKYSRALLETLALIAYRQPITRAEIEQVRGVAVNPNIVKTLIERNWVRVVGHRDVPGRPELLGTTREFLDYFGLRSLDELPALADVKAMGDYNLQLELPNAGAIGVDGKEGGEGAPVALLTNESGDGAAEGAAAAAAEGAAEGAAAAVAEGAAEGAVGAVAEGAGEGVTAAAAEGAAGEGVTAVAGEDVAGDGAVATVAEGVAGEGAVAVVAEGVAGEGEVAAVSEGAAGEGSASVESASGASASAELDSAEAVATEGADFVAQVETLEVESVMADGSDVAAVAVTDAEAVAGADAEAAEGTAVEAVASASAAVEGAAIDAVAGADDSDTTHAEHSADSVASDTIAEAADSHAAHAGDEHAANDAVAAAEGDASRETHAADEHPAHDAVVAHPTLTRDHAAQHPAESDESEASESRAAHESLESLDDGADDDADEDELSADGHGSRELVAAPRDGDE